jgi:hypothetical protein
LCGFNFAGLRDFLDKKDHELHKELQEAHKDGDEHKQKLLITAVKLNIGDYLAPFIFCSWGSHYNTLFREFIARHLDDLNILKKVLKSDVISLDKGNVTTSKNGYRMFWELYKYLMKVNSSEVRDFLRLEFREFYRKYYSEQYRKHLRPKNKSDNSQNKLL